jgi:hypothetical protein
MAEKKRGKDFSICPHNYSKAIEISPIDLPHHIHAVTLAPPAYIPIFPSSPLVSVHGNVGSDDSYY